MGKAIRPQAITVATVQRFLTYFRGLLVLLVGLLGEGCARQSVGEISDPPRTEQETATELGSRPESVARAERLTLEARGAPPMRARALFERAAYLRERLFRRDHQAIDAFEAIELWRTAAEQPGASCSARLHGILLDGELRREPASTYERLYALKLGEADPVCRGRVDRALLALGAYRPPAASLAALERASAGTARTSSTPTQASAAPPRDATPRVERLEQSEVKAQAPRVVRRVVLDPGHGGRDPGATGPNGLREKDVTLDIAHRAAPILAHELGITTLLTRDSDQFVPLDERSARANAFHADLFLSIHCNATDDGIANAVTSFVLDRGSEARAMRLAARENAAAAKAASELASAFDATSAPSHVEASLRFAGLLQRAARASLEKSYPDIPDGGVQRAGLYVLAGARMPAVLFEASFISNASGATHLSSADFRQRIADAIVNAIRAYRDGR